MRRKRTKYAGIKTLYVLAWAALLAGIVAAGAEIAGVLP